MWYRRYSAIGAGRTNRIGSDQMTIKQLLEEMEHQLRNGFGYLIECDDRDVDPNAETQILPACLVARIREAICD